MSGTQIDFSSFMIDRQQDIASWAEGDIDQLSIRDKNRYQKRKSAIIEYFQSDLPVEEISASHRLSPADELEVLARSCCVLHEDGRPWGFRALVPGINVVEDGVSASASVSSKIFEQEIVSTNAQADTQVATQEEEEKKVETDKHQAIVASELIELPRTPMPVHAQTTGEQAEAAPDLDEDRVDIDEMVEQEEFPALSDDSEEAEEEERDLADVVAEQDEDEIVADEMVEQEEFPALSEAITEFEEEEAGPVEVVAGQDEGEIITDKMVEQEEFLAVRSEEEIANDEKVEQEEFPALASATQETDMPASAAGDEDEDGEPTDKRKAVKPQAPDVSRTTEAGSVNGTAVAEVEELQDEQADEVEEEAARETRVAEGETSAVVEDERDEFVEQDTVEVARLASEERRNRVAAVETIKVPAALLEALEKADQELESSNAESVTPVGEDETGEEGAEGSEKKEDFSLAVLPALSQLEEAQPATAKALTTDEVAALPTRELEAWRRDSRQRTQAPALQASTRSLVEDSRFRVTGKQVALKHAVLRRWNKQGRAQKYQRWVRVVSAAVIASILIILLIPLSVGLVGYNAYTNIKGVANDGVNNLLSLKDLLPANKNDYLSVLNPQKLSTAKTNLQKAQSDFLQLEDMVNRPDIESLLRQFAPQYSSKLDMARRLVRVGLDVSRMGQELIGVAQMGANIVHTPGLLSSSSQKPLLSADDVNMVQAALVHGQYYINDIQTQMSQVNLAEVPFGSATEKAQLAKYLKQIPQAQDLLAQAQTLVGPVAWMLGIGQARHFLVQTLDRGELRPSGGFEGQYGVLTLQNGRMSPFSLRDITLLDYAENGAELGATPPPQYGWMNFGNFGVRDANLSADFPTTAQIVMRYFQQEGGGPIDGVLQFTPVVIEQFLQMTGPLKIAEYNDTITAQNLEDKLHQYQQDPRLIALQQQVTGQDNKATRKAFTSLVGSLLMDRIKKLPPAQMMSFGKILLQDLKTRDLQVYLNNPVAEQWLTQHGNSGAMPQFTNGTDGFMVVQANVSISKAAQYVKSTFNDQVTLDAQGGATHNLTITLNYQQHGPVYGFNTYADYMRVYAPADAHLINAYGFNTGSTLCTPGKPPSKPTNGQGGNGNGNGTGNGNGNGNGNGTGNGNGAGNGTPPVDTGGSYTDDGILITGCGQYYHTFTDTTARSCPDGNYELGYNGMMARPWPIQSLGGPSSQTSDLPGYSMWGGLTLTPKNCVSTITLSWYVPHIVQNTAGKSPYQMIVGHQAGWPDTAEISINASALKDVKSLTYNHVINEDTLVALPALPLPPAPRNPSSPSPTPAVTPTATAKKP